MYKKVGLLSLVFALFACLGLQNIMVLAADSDPMTAIEYQTELEDNHKWDNIPNLWTTQMKELFSAFIKNKSNSQDKLGIFDIKHAKLVSSKELPLEISKDFVQNLNEISKKVYSIKTVLIIESLL